MKNNCKVNISKVGRPNTNSHDYYCIEVMDKNGDVIFELDFTPENFASALVGEEVEAELYQ